MEICVEVKDLSVETVNGFKILEGVSLSVSCGEFVVVSGPSGGGKSTLLKVLLGVKDVLEGFRIEGRVRVLGVDVVKNGFAKLFGKVGVVLQNPVNQVFSLTVEEEIAFPLENAGLDPEEIRKRVEEALEILGLKDLKRTPVNKLSMGQIQRVVLASAIALKPKILILDEPCAYLDPLTKKKFYEYIYMYWRSGGVTVIVVEHDLDYVLPYATKMLILNKKVVAYGDPLEVLNNVNAEDYGIKEPIYVKLCRYLRTSCRKAEDFIICLKKFICRSRE
jgi:energy-coupling factor transporter ATP-binding protein EcfA2